MIRVNVLHRNVRNVLIKQEEISGLAAVGSDLLGHWRNNGNAFRRKLKNLVVYSFECSIIESFILLDRAFLFA